MLCGVAIRDITPRSPIQLCGYPESPVSTGVHDPLHTACFYFADDETRVLYFTSDLLFFGRKRCDKIKQALARETGVPEENILLAATHTHYAPATDCDIYRETIGGELCPEYMDMVQRAMLSAAAEATANTFPAVLSYGVDACGKEAGIGGNRHDPDRYAQDPSVSALVICAQDGTVRGILVNYALHPTVLSPDSSLVSADYVAYVRGTVCAAFPDAVFGFMQGCAGNQSTRYFRKEQSFAEAERFGASIGAAAIRSVQTRTVIDPKARLKARSIWFTPSNMLRLPTLKEAEAGAKLARDQYEALVQSGAPTSDCRSAECTMIGADMMLMTSRDAERYGAETVLSVATPVELHIVAVGSVIVLGIAAEVFADVGLAVKAACPGKTPLFSCVTGAASQSYICSEYAYERSYYEPACSMFGRGTAEELADRLIQEIQLTR